MHGPHGGELSGRPGSVTESMKATFRSEKIRT